MTSSATEEDELPLAHFKKNPDEIRKSCDCDEVKTKPPRNSNFCYFGVDDIYRVRLMVEAVQRCFTSYVQKEIMARETVAVEVDRLDPGDLIHVQTVDAGSALLSVSNNFERNSSPSASSVSASCTTHPDEQNTPIYDKLVVDIPERNPSSSGPRGTNASDQELSFISNEKQPPIENGFHDEFYSAESNYSECDEPNGGKSNSSRSSSSCATIGSPSIDGSETVLDMNDGVNLFDAGKLCKLILRRSGGIYSTRFVEGRIIENSEMKNHKYALASNSTDLSSDSDHSTSDDRESGSPRPSSLSSAISMPSNYLRAQVVESSDFSVDVSCDKPETDDGRRCVSCGFTLPSGNNISGASGYSRSLIRNIDCDICIHCLRPFELWQRAPWRWNLFLKRCDTETCGRLDEHGDYCVSCNFWRRVDFVSDAIHSSSADLITRDGEHSSTNDASTIGRKTPNSSLVKATETGSHGYETGSSGEDAPVASKSEKSVGSASSSGRGSDNVTKILLEEEQLKSSHYFETGVDLPRVKYVCRNQESVNGTRLPRATFPVQSSDVGSGSAIILSAMPQWKKESIWQVASPSDDDDEVPCWPPSNRPKSMCQAKANSLTHGNSKNSEDQCKGAKTGAKRRRDDSSSKKVAKPSFKRTARCRQCKGCLATDCGTCANCLDMPKFGGPGIAKQACVQRQCELLLALKRQRREEKVPPRKDV